MGRVKKAIRKWLGIKEAQDLSIQIQEQNSFLTNVYRNRLWYRGDPSELDQFFHQAATDNVSRARFWASSPSKGNNIRKIHSGLPGMIVNTLADIVITDMEVFDFKKKDNDLYKIWLEIEKENELQKLVAQAIEETLVVGDGAFKISFDTDLSAYPILEFFSGENVEYKYNRGRIEEVEFFTQYEEDDENYTLKEVYGKGYVTYALYNENDEEVSLSAIEELADLVPVKYDGDYILAVPMLFYSSPKWDGRGRSIYDLKTDVFDALDETISQWQDAIRLGRIKRYIPQSIVPRDPNTGNTLPINTMDNQYIAIGDDMSESGQNAIQTVQPTLQYEGYISTYINNLDLCLQGIISPSTLGIDTKKLDNAEAQREKEKTTLYTRQKIIDVLYDILPELVNTTLKANATLSEQTIEDIDCTIGFGEYANPSFEAQVETIGKASASSIMSVRAQVETLWGDSREDKWIDEEIERILTERGIAEVMEPSRVPHGFAEEGMIDDMDRLGGQYIDRDGAGNVPVDEQELEAPPSRGDERGRQVDTVASASMEKS